MKRRYYYMEEIDWKQLVIKMKENGFVGKGSHERFMELLARNKLIILTGNTEAVELRSILKSVHS